MEIITQSASLEVITSRLVEVARLMERLIKIARLFKPDGVSYPDWFTKIRNR